MESPSRRPPQKQSPDLRGVIGDDLEALIRYAHFAPDDEALAIVQLLISDGTWAKAVMWFLPLIGRLLTPERPAFALEVLQLVIDDRHTRGELRPELHDIVATLGRECTDAVCERLVSWFVEVAGPSEAKLAMRLVRFVPPLGRDHTSLEKWCRPLIPWLLDHGSAELCRGEQPLVMLHLIETCCERFSDRLIAALKVMERSDNPDAVFTVDDAAERIVHRAVEVALGRGLPADWVDQVFGGARSALNALWSARFFAPLDPANQMPRLREALLAALARGRWRTGLGRNIWMLAFQYEPPGSVIFEEDGFETARHALIDARHEPVIGDDTLAAWAEVIATAWFGRFGPCCPAAEMVPPGVWTLDLLAADARLAPGIARALVGALQAAPPDCSALSKAREVMARGASDPRLTSVALLLLPRADEAAAPAVETLDDLRELLHAIVAADWSSKIAGEDVRALFRGSHHVRITEPGDLDSEILIDFGDDEILTSDTSTYRRIIREICKVGTRDEALAACTLYFVHEVLHVRQGIQRKARVAALRATGSEHTVMMFDLEADDCAARIVAASTSWSLGDLKNVQSKGALAFPASLYHTNASVTRKSVRLISLRFELLIRELSMFDVAREAEGFASVEVPYGAGGLLVMWNAETRTLLTAIRIDACEAERITCSARDGRTLGELDDLIRQLLARSQSLPR